MISTLLHHHCELGENPLWNPEDGSLCWTDISAGALHRIQLATRKHEVIYRGVPVGGFTLQSDGALLLFRVNDIALLHPDGRVEVMRRMPPWRGVTASDVTAFSTEFSPHTHLELRVVGS